ncbi:MAG TPA: NAD(P)-dependent methylenetetrahydromethanopterin dehydrogenase [Gemmatimonadaceae bacterium]|nr:NAD(P)-dependent methylenetetrahydromethanopterin dehydrogenase [Gemmatimonadaceae bacterium]
MRKLLLQLDGSRLASSFDRVVAYDGGADEVLSYGGVTVKDIEGLIHGAIFTRGPKDLKNTAVFIGGSDMTLGEEMLAKAVATFFGPMRVSVMLDPNGSNTTAVAAVMKIEQAAGDLRGKRVVVTAGTGPVGIRAAGLLAKAGADVVITSRHRDAGEHAVAAIEKRLGAKVRCLEMPDSSHAARALEGAEVLLNAGPAGVNLVPRDAWAGRKGLRVAVDLNAVPPLGVEGIESPDNGTERDGVTAFGALGVGNLKMKIHHACIARLFERNDLVLDAETIADLARGLAGSSGAAGGGKSSSGGAG